DEPPSTALVCNYCSATAGAAGGPLLGCASCRVAAYCCAEHQKLVMCMMCSQNSSSLHPAHYLAGHTDEIVCRMER
ncbi:hypothetical protein PENTCL1PPCAC_3810, partial [Pristionchus entomophagus]